MHSMRERAAELGGTTVIVGRPGGGTVMTSRIPLTEPSS
jgi:signal transduction histidine kinase